MLQASILADEEGTYWVEANGQTVHFKLPGDTDPSEHRIEITVREQCFAPDKSYAAEGPRTGFVFILFVVAAVFAIAIPAFIGQANRIRARM